MRLRPGWFITGVALLVLAGVLGGMLTALFLSLSDDVSTLQHQVLSLGVEPAVPTADQPPPTNGSDGNDGDDGQTGRDGRDGLTIIGPPGEDGADSAVPGPAGKDGADSTVAGPRGADSVVPGPQGPPGESVVGPQGPIGPAGAPAAFSFVAAGVTYTCTPVAEVSPTVCVSTMP